MQQEVIDYWNAIAAKAGDNRKWHDLHPMHQQMIIQSINLLISVLSQK